MSHHSKTNAISAAGLLVTLGIIFGDIGTSPLYVLKAIIGEAPVNELVVLGAISCIFWTLTLQTTVKYIILTLRADNKGEGGIFSLYNLVKRTKVSWLIFPAIIGGSAILAEGVITPSISVSSAVEGLRIYNPDIQTIPIVLGIIIVLFTIQQFGTSVVGKSFGPLMLIWFGMLGFFGTLALIEYPEVLKAVNPWYAYRLLVLYPDGFWLLGAVFLCTTGAEALYSDLGHCGKENIRISWIFVKTTLLLNYFGQGAWLLKNSGMVLHHTNPFFSIYPSWFLIVAIIIATLATIVASQALISGSFTLINEAMRLNLWPKARVIYPTNVRGQIYIPSVNWLLCVGCSAIVLYFKESSSMEAAYGLTIILGMMMSSTLLYYYMILKRYGWGFIFLFTLTYSIVETSFMIANLKKFVHGGWVSLLIASTLFAIMWIWRNSRKIKNRFTEFVDFNKYLPLLKELNMDDTVPKYATNLVYLTNSDYDNEIETKIIYSIINKQPKRADIYWFVHVHVVDDPHTMEYKVIPLISEHAIRVEFRLGFRIEPKINLFLKQVIEDMVTNQEVDIISRYTSLRKHQIKGDFRFVVIDRIVTHDFDLPVFERLIMDAYSVLKYFSLKEKNAFGLDTSNVTVETVPLFVSGKRETNLRRIS
jgi:KUP system potassium uptake protein